MSHNETVQTEFTRQAEAFRESPTLGAAEVRSRVGEALGSDRVLDLARGPGLLLPVALVLAILGCAPIGPLPGGALDGAPASPPVGWSFTDAHRTVQLETRPGDPYSVNVWCAVVGEKLYVAAGQGGDSTWARALLDDPRARVRIGDALYEVTAVLVTDDAEIRDYIDSLSRKYSISAAELADFQPGSDDPPDAVLFRLEPRPRLLPSVRPDRAGLVAR